MPGKPQQKHTENAPSFWFCLPRQWTAKVQSANHIQNRKGQWYISMCIKNMPAQYLNKDTLLWHSSMFVGDVAGGTYFDTKEEAEITLLEYLDKGVKV